MNFGLETQRPAPTAGTGLGVKKRTLAATYTLNEEPHPQVDFT
jgi:hypothetical protein